MAYVTGTDKVARQLRAARANVGKEIRKALDKSGKAIERNARLLAPVASGELAESISYKVVSSPDGFSVVVEAGKLVTNSRGVEFSLGSLIEQGGPEGRESEAYQSFLIDAYMAEAKRARGRVERAINKAIRDAVRGGG